MPIHRPSELHQLLDQLGIKPKKGLSQNFLIDGNIAYKIAHTVPITANDIVLEIGPGPGALTEIILDSGAQVIAVEKDQILAKSLLRLITLNRSLTVYPNDIMNFEFEKEIGRHLKDKKAKVIANLPYHLTSPILSLLIPKFNLFSDVVVMVQEEVARRFVAKAGSVDYGHFSLFLSYYSNPFLKFTVSKNCFYPVPNVNSAVVHFALKEPSRAILDPEKFFQMTRMAFEHRRKMLRSSLTSLYTSEQVTISLTKAGLNSLARPEELSLEDFIKFFNYL